MPMMSDGTIAPSDAPPRLPSEMFLVCSSDASDRRTEVICACASMSEAVEEAKKEVFRGVNSGRSYWVESVEVRR